MRNIAVCIPTLGISPHLENLVRTLMTDKSVGYIEIMNNGNLDLSAYSYDPWFEEHLPYVVVQDTQGKSIYEMWNDFRVRQDWNNYTAFLNDDIVIKPETLTLLRDALENDPTMAITYPDYAALWDYKPSGGIVYTDTTAGAGGMAGFCYMLRPNTKIPLIDENLKLYWGDDDLVKQVISQGYKIGRVSGLPILHAGSYTINRMDSGERNRLMEADRAYFNQKYGENRSPVG